jgi:adenylate cyclase class 2
MDRFVFCRLPPNRMGSRREVEVKFQLVDARSFAQRLRAAGFRLLTRRTHEMNSLYDLPGGALRREGELLRLRKYGADWVLTHKAKGKSGRHKSRVETETKVADGQKMDAILRALGYVPVFRYEKFRAEWGEGEGHIVLDQTPIGDFGEIEGSPRWIDRTARALGVSPRDYITQSYAELFFKWKRRVRSRAPEMTFRAVGKRK